MFDPTRPAYFHLITGVIFYFAHACNIFESEYGLSYMERPNPIAELGAKEWDCLERLFLYPELVNRWAPITGSDGYEWSLGAFQGTEGERIVIAFCNREISGDTLSFSADINSGALEAMTTGGLGPSLWEVLQEVADQMDFGMALPVGDDLDPFRDLISDLGQLYR